MKIVFTFLTFGKDIFAGMENSLYQLCRGIKEIGHDPLVFTSYAYGSQTNIDGIKIYRSKHLPVIFYGGDLALRKRILCNKERIELDFNKMLQKETPDFIVSWDPLWGFVQYLEIKSPFNIPVVLSFRVINSYRILQDVKHTHFKRYFALSEFLKEELIKKGIIEDIIILPNSIDYNYLIQKSTKQKRKKVILCNARLSPEKGIVYAIKAFSKIAKTHPDFLLWLCSGEFPFGDTSKTKKLAYNLTKQLNIEKKVLFLPNIEWDKIPEIIGQAYISILPSLSETFGRSILESLAVGTPVIATTVGNLPNLVGDNGILIPPKSVRNLYVNIKQLIEDNDLYNYYLNRGRIQARNFDRKIIAAQFIEKLKNI